MDIFNAMVSEWAYSWTGVLCDCKHILLESQRVHVCAKEGVLSVLQFLLIVRNWRGFLHCFMNISVKFSFWIDEIKIYDSEATVPVKMLVACVLALPFSSLTVIPFAKIPSSSVSTCNMSMQEIPSTFSFSTSLIFLLTLSCSSLSMNATGWPWRFPDGEVMGVFTSAWASTQMTHRSGHCWAWPDTDPIARLWKERDSLILYLVFRSVRLRGWEYPNKGVIRLTHMINVHAVV